MPEIVDEFMFLRVLVDVGDNVPELTLIRNQDTTERVLEEAAAPAAGGVDGLGVGVEEIGELLANISRP